MNRAEHIRSRLSYWEVDKDLVELLLGTANEPEESQKDAPEANQHG